MNHGTSKSIKETIGSRRLIFSSSVAFILTVPFVSFGGSASVRIALLSASGSEILYAQEVEDVTNNNGTINISLPLAADTPYRLQIDSFVDSSFIAAGSAGYKASMQLTADFGGQTPIMLPVNGSTTNQHALGVELHNLDLDESHTNRFNTNTSTFFTQSDSASLSIAKTGAFIEKCSINGNYAVTQNSSLFQFDGAISTDSSSPSWDGVYNNADGFFGTRMSFNVSQATTLTLSGTMTALGRGVTENYPILPVISGHNFFFIGGHFNMDGMIIDPPLADGYEFQTLTNCLFTEIVEFPTGIISTNDQFEVQVNHSSLGKYSAGSGVNFVSLLGAGVTNFIVTGIKPAADAENTEAFPIRLRYSNVPTIAFSMTPILLPTLSIQILNSSTFQLTWPTNAADYVLESATTLSQNPWTQVTNAPVLNGDQYSVTGETTNINRYYRLKK